MGAPGQRGQSALEAKPKDLVRASPRRTRGSVATQKNPESRERSPLTPGGDGAAGARGCVERLGL